MSGGLKEMQRKAVRSGAARGGEGEARRRVAGPGDVWLGGATHVPALGCHVPAQRGRWRWWRGTLDGRTCEVKEI